MIKLSLGNKKGQQLIMPMARSEENPDLLKGYKLKAIDLRKDWPKILDTILNNKLIQKAHHRSFLDDDKSVWC